MLQHHTNDQFRYDQQVDNARQYVLPFVEKTKEIKAGIQVLEIGCGEGGVLLPFAEKGAFCLGVELDSLRIDIAARFLEKEIAAGKMKFQVKNVYDEDFLLAWQHQFDIIILKDAIEHIPEQEKFIPYLKNFLKGGGQIFFGFPPWYMPFGGHQQVMQSKIGSKLPWYHILPRPVYKGMLQLFGESKGKIEELMEIRSTRITIERFERIVRNSGLKVLNRQHYLINPIYKYKFGLKPRKQASFISAIPFIKDLLTTCVYYTIG